MMIHASINIFIAYLYLFHPLSINDDIRITSYNNQNITKNGVISEIQKLMTIHKYLYLINIHDNVNKSKKKLNIYKKLVSNFVLFVSASKTKNTTKK